MTFTLTLTSYNSCTLTFSKFNFWVVKNEVCPLIFWKTYALRFRPVEIGKNMVRFARWKWKKQNTVRFARWKCPQKMVWYGFSKLYNISLYVQIGFANVARWFSVFEKVQQTQLPLHPAAQPFFTLTCPGFRLERSSWSVPGKENMPFCPFRTWQDLASLLLFSQNFPSSPGFYRKVVLGCTRKGKHAILSF